MRPALTRCTLAATLALLAVGCSPQPAADAAQAPDVSETAPPEASRAAAAPAQDATAAFSEDAPGGLRVAAVPGMHAAPDFKRSYLALDSWKLFAEPGSQGTPLVALVRDGSNEITAAELRIGRSTDAAAVKACLALPAEATSAADSVAVGGVPFTHFSSGDAAMSHYLSAESYRAVQGGACYAIDLVVNGIRPEVYDPPRVAPFPQDDAKAQLQKALAAVSWQH
ncbi:MAG: hypothetical protein GAK31_00307 [Stenotrophomonas maltophilia]|uniref:Lipoprotein n=1 Tax=Stenotrophomonas maltophilia TaxID=40324 RepID=A0A7V8FJ75_STEMA|nr:MAG: hypothetical protein GAK31_00307 [Stenotrophomonas maltophilia]